MGIKEVFGIKERRCSTNMKKDYAGSGISIESTQNGIDQLGSLIPIGKTDASLPTRFNLSTELVDTTSIRGKAEA